MKESVYKGYGELPLFLNAKLVAQVLGISPSSAYELMNEDKKRHTVWLTSDAWSQVETSYTKDNCTTKNEYIEKAIRFYTGYLNTQNAASYLPRVLADVLDGKLGALGTRIGKLLFKLVVEQDMIANITAAVNEVHLDDVERLRARCIREIRQTNGVINLEDAVRYQNGWDDQWSG